MAKSKIRVLLVEDNPADAGIVEEILTQEGNAPHSRIEFVIHRAGRLSKALEYLNSHDIHIILLDLFLPDSKGTDTFAKIHSLYPTVPVIVLTGIDDEEVGKCVVKQGADDYLDKGSDLEGNLVWISVRDVLERNGNRLTTKGV